MLPIDLEDQVLLLEVSIATWRSVLDAAGETERLSAGSFTHGELADSFIKQPPSAALYSAWELIQELGTEDGRDHLEQVADDLKLDLGISLTDTPSRELIALLWIRGQTESPIRDVLFRSQLTQRSATSTRTYREFVGKDGARGAPIDEETLKAEVSNWCRDNRQGEVVSVIVYSYDEEWHCQIVRGDPIRRVSEVRDHAVSTLEYRPAATDLLRYDPRTGRIGIATRSPRVLQGYRTFLGKIVAHDETFFAGENVCSLKLLQMYGAELFAQHHVPGILRVDVVELHWRRGDKDKLWVSGQDCFRILRDLQAKLDEGELIEAKLSFCFVGGGRRGHAILKTPNRIEIKAGQHQALVERLLDSAGIRGCFSDDGTRRTFWSLYPGAER